MKGSIRFGRLLLAGVLAVATVSAVPQVAQAGPAPASYVPSKLRVEEGNKLFLVAAAEGVQIYRCNVVAGVYSWGLVAPDARLYDARHKLIGTHFAGPTWQATDGSRFVGTKVDGVIVDTSSIPWLLLSKVSSAVGVDGDRLYGTTFIQRLNTTAGLPPEASTCNAVSVGAREESEYTADYYCCKKSPA